MPIDGKDFPLVGGLHTTGIADLQRKVEQVSRLESRSSGKSDSYEEAEKAATEFEALLLQEMIKSMWNNVPSAGLVSGSREEELYRDMLNEALAKDISEKQSIGIKDIILREMMKDEKS